MHPNIRSIYSNIILITCIAWLALPGLHCLACVGIAGEAHADTLTKLFQESRISGQIRSYSYSRLFGAPDVPNASVFSLSGILNVQTAPFLGGFGVGVSFFTANSLGVCVFHAIRPLNPSPSGR